MLTVSTVFRNELSPEGKELFDDVNLQRVLGASTHIRLIGDLFLNIAQTIPDRERMGKTVRGIAEHFCATRGESSQAISNAIRQMLRPIGRDDTDIAAAIRRGVEEYRREASENMQRIKEYLWKLLEGKKTLFLPRGGRVFFVLKF